MARSLVLRKRLEHSGVVNDDDVSMLRKRLEYSGVVNDDDVGRPHAWRVLTRQRVLAALRVGNNNDGGRSPRGAAASARCAGQEGVPAQAARQPPDVRCRGHRCPTLLRAGCRRNRRVATGWAYALPSWLQLCSD